MKKTGKSLYKNFIIIVFFLISIKSYANDGRELVRDLSELRSMSSEKILFHEKDYDQRFMEKYQLGVKDCRAIGEKSENLESVEDSNGDEAINQGLCFEKLVEYKKAYSLIKYEARKKIIIEANTRALDEIKRVHDAKVRLIQRSSPEEISSFEL